MQGYPYRHTRGHTRSVGLRQAAGHAQARLVGHLLVEAQEELLTHHLQSLQAPAAAQGWRAVRQPAATPAVDAAAPGRTARVTAQRAPPAPPRPGLWPCPPPGPTPQAWLGPAGTGAARAGPALRPGTERDAGGGAWVGGWLAGWMGATACMHALLLLRPALSQARPAPAPPPPPSAPTILGADEEHILKGAQRPQLVGQRQQAGPLRPRDRVALVQHQHAGRRAPAGRHAEPGAAGAFLHQAVHARVSPLQLPRRIHQQQQQVAVGGHSPGAAHALPVRRILVVPARGGRGAEGAAGSGRVPATWRQLGHAAAASAAATPLQQAELLGCWHCPPCGPTPQLTACPPRPACRTAPPGRAPR